MDTRDVRHANFLLLLARSHSDAALARDAGINKSHAQQLKRGRHDPTGRAMGEKVARRIEEALELAPGWLDVQRASVSAVTSAHISDLVSIKDFAPSSAEDDSPAYVSAAWAKRESVDVDDLLRVYASDDAEAPRITRGDELIVERCRGLRDGERYALLVDERVRTRVARKLASGAWALRCASDDYPDDIVSADAVKRLELIGRVLLMRGSARPA